MLNLKHEIVANDNHDKTFCQFFLPAKGTYSTSLLTLMCRETKKETFVTKSAASSLREMKFSLFTHFTSWGRQHIHLRHIKQIIAVK